MFRTFGLVFAAFALFAIAGGQWAVLQTVAWAGMLQDYTRCTGSLAVAVAHTFDGEHPCSLCREIATAKVKQQRQQSTAPEGKDAAKVKATLTPATFTLFAPAVIVARRWTAPPIGPSRADQPPTPPPKGGAVTA